MSNVRHGNGGHSPIRFLCRSLGVWATWVRVAATLSQAATDSNVASSGFKAATFALIPSAPRATALIPSAPVASSPVALIPSAPRPSGLIPSLLPPSSNLPPASPPPVPIPSEPARTGLIPSGPLPSDPVASQPSAIPSTIDSPTQTGVPPVPSIPNVTPTFAMPSGASTQEGLRPIPAPTTAPGDPDGHHEIPEPNFTATAPCRGCSPVIEISATGWGDSWPSWPTQPAAEHQETTQHQPQATITAGPSQITISKEPSGPGFVIGGSTTVKLGQTIIINKTPVVVQAPGGRTEVVVGTQTVPLKANNANPPPGQITEPPVFLPLTIGSQTLTPIADTDSSANPAVPALYIIAGQTLLPGGAAIVVSSTTYSLLPSGTAIVVNGHTSTLQPNFGSVFTTTELPALTLWGHIYTANRAGYYVLAPGKTLIPGGAPLTISGSTISVEPHGTKAVIQGSTSFMQPQTTVVTLTRTAAQGLSGGGDAVYSTGSGAKLPNPTGKPHSGAARLGGVGVGVEGWPEGMFMFIVFFVGWAAVWL